MVYIYTHANQVLEDAAREYHFIDDFIYTRVWWWAAAFVSATLRESEGSTSPKVLSQHGPQSMFDLSQAFHAERVIEFDSNYKVGPKTSYKWSEMGIARINGLK